MKINGKIKVLVRTYWGQAFGVSHSNFSEQSIVVVKTGPDSLPEHLNLIMLVSFKVEFLGQMSPPANDSLYVQEC